MAMTQIENDLDRCLHARRQAHSLALVTYLTAGFPDAASTLRWGPLLTSAGADVLELGVPFSDPMGDGPTIQRSSQRALEGGMTLHGSLALAAAVLEEAMAPVVLMSYYNPLLHMGMEAFALAAGEAGVSGVIVPDLPTEEAGELRDALRDRNVHLISLLAPTSTEERIVATVRSASGFIYCMALTGVTGARAALAEDLPAFLARVRALTALPLIVGFGISRPEHLAHLLGMADGAVVASALVNVIEDTPEPERDLALSKVVKELHASCYGS